MVESAEKFNLIQIRLNLYLPHIHEDFFATWSRRSRSRSDQRWNVELPLVVDGMIVGVLAVAGVQNGVSVSTTLTAFAELVEPLEGQLGDMLAEREGRNVELAIAKDGEMNAPISDSVESPTIST